MVNRWTLALPEHLRAELWGHLFPGDGDEHGAVLLAGIAAGPRGQRLLVRELICARDHQDYLPGQFGYRALSAEFVQRAALRARDEGLAYLAVHCHGGTDHVDFSPIDLASHERGYPALSDITGQLVGGLVAAENALAGDLWLPDGRRTSLAETVVPGRTIRRLFPHPPPPPPPAAATAGWDRQIRLLGDRGQQLLAEATVTIIGLGGVGSILAELLARIGVGALVLIDPQRVDPTNLSRLVATRRLDAMTWLRQPNQGARRQRIGARLAAPKVRVAARNIHRANARTTVRAIFTDLADPTAAAAAAGSDYIFLAADTPSARHLTNAIVEQYLIPGVQSGVKIRCDEDTGHVEDIHIAVRPLIPGQACMWCAELIDADKLAVDSLPDVERGIARYIPEVAAPSVMTLNGIAASEAATAFLFSLTGLLPSTTAKSLLRFPLADRLVAQTPSKNPNCRWCGTRSDSNLGRGASQPLPIRSRRTRTVLGRRSSPAT